MRAFVTGIAGFVGSHLAEMLIARGVQVHGLIMPGGPLENLDEIRGNPMSAAALRLYEADLGDLERLMTVIEEVRPEQVYHLAAASSVRRSLENPGEAFQVNVMGTRNLLEAMRRAGISPRILLVSSAEVYGESARLPRPLREDDSLLPVTPYGASKAAAELIARRYVEEFGLDIVRVRPFPHTGPRHAPNFVFSDWARQLAEIETGRRPPRLQVGNLDVRRDLSDVRDVVEAYWLALGRGETGAVYNVCSGRVYALREVLNILVGLTDLDVEVVADYKRLRPHDVEVLAGRFEALRARTGWEATRPLNQTLGDLLSHWRAGQSVSPSPPRDPLRR